MEAKTKLKQAMGVLVLTGAVGSPALGDPVLSIEGECPGLIEATVTGATPNFRVAVLYSIETGSCVIPPQQPCGGHTVFLRCRTLQLAAVIITDENGEGRTSATAGARACGGYLQAIDLGFCTLSNVVQLE